MFKPDKRLTRWYAEYNKLYWDNRLPAAVSVGWNDELDPDSCALHQGVEFTPKEGANFRASVIHLDKKQHVGARDPRLSLLHEMCHVALFPYSKHGVKFKNEKRRIAMLGALDDLW